MSHDHSQFGASLEAHDDQSINPSANPALEQLVDPARRNVLKGGLSLAALSFFTGVMGLSLRAHASSPLPNFKGVPVQIDPRFDHVLVAGGYSATPFFSWGDPVEAGAPQWNPDASDDWQAPLKQAGDNHDGMDFFAFEGDGNRGLLVMNHEYVNPPLHPGNCIDQSKPRPLAEVRPTTAASVAAKCSAPSTTAPPASPPGTPSSPARKTGTTTSSTAIRPTTPRACRTSAMAWPPAAPQPGRRSYPFPISM